MFVVGRKMVKLTTRHIGLMAPTQTLPFSINHSKLYYVRLTRLVLLLVLPMHVFVCPTLGMGSLVR